MVDNAARICPTVLYLPCRLPTPYCLQAPAGCAMRYLCSCQTCSAVTHHTSAIRYHTIRRPAEAEAPTHGQEGVPHLLLLLYQLLVRHLLVHLLRVHLLCQHLLILHLLPLHLLTPTPSWRRGDNDSRSPGEDCLASLPGEPGSKRRMAKRRAGHSLTCPSSGLSEPPCATRARAAWD